MYAQPLLQAQSPHAFLQTKSLILVLIPSHFIKLLKTSILKHHLKLTSDAVHHRLIRDFIEDDLKNGTLIEIPLDVPIPKRVVGFCCHPQDMPDTLREFLEFSRTFRKA